jgi:uncharacterized protein (DUF885 family)
MCLRSLTPRACVGFWVVACTLVAGSAAVASAAAPAVPVAAARSGSADLASRRAALTAFLDEQWQYSLRIDPENASVVGDKRYNDRWNDRSPDAIAADLAAQREFLRRLEAIDPAGFPEQEALSRELMLRKLRESLATARFKPWEMEISQLFGLPLVAPQIVAQIDFDSTQDFEDLLTRYQRLPAAFTQVIDQARAGIADGLTQPRSVIDKMVQQAAALASQPADQSPYAAPTLQFPKTVPVADRTRLRAALLASIRDEVQPAYRRYADFLKTEYLSHGRSEPGLWSLPDGAARYAQALRTMTTTDSTPQQIHEIGLAQVAEVERQMLAIAKRLGYPDLKSLGAEIARDPVHRAHSAEQIVEIYRGHLDEMATRLPQWFGRLPKAKLIVVQVEPFREKEASAAAYVLGSPDFSRPGWVQVNTGNPTSRTTLTMESNAYHEGIPGHHLQFSIALEMPQLPPFRQNSWYPAFTEGWALYAERLGKEIGLFGDPYSDFGRLQDEMLRSIRLVVDTGIHAKHWSRAQVIQFFHDHSATDDEVEVQSETDRYMVWPGQALAYKIGQLKIVELRERARKRLGSRFDIRAFHDELLGAGALPLDVVEARMNRWIASQAAGH